MRKKTKTKPKLEKDISASIAVIILKGIASDLRSKYKDLRIEAHPRSKTQAEIFIGRRDIEHSVKATLFNQNMTQASTTFKTEYKITKNGKQTKKDVSHLIVNIEEPDSLTKLELWLNDLIDVHVANVEEESQDRSIT